MRLAVLFGGVLILAPTVLLAQTPGDFSTLRANVGDVIFVIDEVTGAEIAGRLGSVSPSALTIDGHTVTPTRGLTIQRRGDPVWEGAAIGSGVGVLMGLTIAGEACSHRSTWDCTLKGAAIYGVIGALVDLIHVGRTTIYQSPRGPEAQVVPVIRRRNAGIAVALSF